MGAVIVGKKGKTMLNIIPQKFSFSRPTIKNVKGETISNGIDVTINIDAFQADKTKVREELSTIFAEVLEYFE